MSRRTKAGAAKKGPPEPLSLNECVPHAPRRVDQPQFEDMSGDRHADEGDCRDANMRYVLNMIVEHDVAINVGWLGHEVGEEDVVEFLLRNRCQLIVAMCARGEVGRDAAKEDDVEDGFSEFMRSTYGKDWQNANTEAERAIRAGLKNAFIAGQAWYCGR